MGRTKDPEEAVRARLSPAGRLHLTWPGPQVSGEKVHELHPLAVHFPIGVILIYPWVELTAAITRQAAYGFVAIGLLVAGTIGSMVASATGEAAFEHAVEKGFSVELLESHEEWSEATPWVFIVVLAFRLFLSKKTRFGAWAGFGLGLAAVAFVVQVGRTGGELVYQHGVGVKGFAPKAAAPASEP